jgi:Barren protein.
MNLNEDLGEGILLQMNSKTLNKKNHSSSNSLEKFTSVVEMLTSNKLSKNNAFENRMIDNIFEIFHTLETKTEDSETI